MWFGWCGLGGFWGVEGLDTRICCGKRGKIFRRVRLAAAIARAFSPQACGGPDPGAAPQAAIERAVGPFQAKTKVVVRAVLLPPIA